MIIEIGDNGLRSKYWWTPYDIPGTEDPIQAAYLAIRQICPFLTDDNHDWEAKDYGPCKEDNKRLKEYIQSSRYSIHIKRKVGQEFYIYGAPTRHWFHFCYRVPGEEY